MGLEDLFEAAAAETDKRFDSEGNIQDGPAEPAQTDNTATLSDADTDTDTDTDAADAAAALADGDTDTDNTASADASSADADTDADLAEVDGKTFFYHPKAHAAGEETHPNTYKDRNQAELGGIAKLERMRELAGKLKEQKKGVLTVGLPGFIGKDLNKLESATEDEIIGMNAEELRTYLKEADQAIMRMDGKLKRTEEAAQKQQQAQEQQQQQKEITSKAAEAIQKLKINTNEPGLDTVDKVVNIAKKQVGVVINELMQEEIKALEDFIEDDDAEDRLGKIEYRKELAKRQKDILDKKATLESDYTGYVDSLKQYAEAQAKAAQQNAGEPELSPAEKVRLRSAAFEEFVEDTKTYDSLMDNAEIASSFNRWAIRHKDKYNGLLVSDDYIQAKADWDKELAEARARRKSDSMKAGKAGKNAAANKGKGDTGDNPIPQPTQPQARRLTPVDLKQKIDAQLDQLAKA